MGYQRRVHGDCSSLSAFWKATSHPINHEGFCCCCSGRRRLCCSRGQAMVGIRRRCCPHRPPRHLRRAGDHWRCPGARHHPLCQGCRCRSPGCQVPPLWSLRSLWRPSQRLSHGWDTATALAVSTEDTVLATLLPPLLLPPPSPFASMVLLPLDTVCTSVTLMLMLRPSQRLMPGTDTVAFTATALALAMEGMAMVDSRAMERGPLTLTPSHGWDMVDSMAVGPMVSPPSWPTPTAQ